MHVLAMYDENDDERKCKAREKGVGSWRGMK
jgi:hypothetical protein